MELKMLFFIPISLEPRLGDRGLVEHLDEANGDLDKDDLRASVDFHGGSIILEENFQIRLTEVGDWEVWGFRPHASGSLDENKTVE
jgi:hypothetical protein